MTYAIKDPLFSADLLCLTARFTRGYDTSCRSCGGFDHFSVGQECPVIHIFAEECVIESNGKRMLIPLDFVDLIAPGDCYTRVIFNTPPNRGS